MEIVEKSMFTNPEFIISAAAPKQFPHLLTTSGKEMSEVAVVGKSNVGKSSLINHITNNKHLAYVSATPGKTQLINFFTIDKKFCLVDLPGYGFAKVPLAQKMDWGHLIQEYLSNRPQLKLIIFLCDLRHPPSADDIAFIQWATHFQKPFLIVFTKADKLNAGSIENSARRNFSLLFQGIEAPEAGYITYSIKEGKGRTILIHKIKEILAWD